MRFLSSEGWKAKSKPASVLMVSSRPIFSAALTRRLSRRRQLLAEQGVDRLQGGDLAALELAQRVLQHLERARHLEPDKMARMRSRVEGDRRAPS